MDRADSVSGHTSLNSTDSEQTLHDICVGFYLLDSKSLIINKKKMHFIAFRKTCMSTLKQKK